MVEKYNSCMNCALLDRESLDRVSWTNTTPAERIGHEPYLILNWYKTYKMFIKLQLTEIHAQRPPLRSYIFT